LSDPWTLNPPITITITITVPYPGRGTGCAAQPAAESGPITLEVALEAKIKSLRRNNLAFLI